MIKKTKIAIVGLGYVGLPLAVEFGKKIKTVGFDIKKERIEQLKKGIDLSKEMAKNEIAKAKKLSFTDNLDDIKECNFFIIAVPTPVSASKFPDLTPLEKSSELVGMILKKNDVVVYESTVYPGATEEVCVPILEKVSGLKFNKDFFAGYSPERISPADKNQVKDIVKVTSGSTPSIGKYVDDVYGLIIKAGTHLVSNIKTAEACKVIENTQRDVNIAYMNEISMLLDKLGLDTQEVVKAMRTKWCALPFVPGLVGGHCIGVDPYYLITKAQEVGYNMQLAKSARIINDSMPCFIVDKIIALLCRRSINPVDSRALVMGATFKEDCVDIRNARPFDIANELKKYGISVDMYDPVANKEIVFVEHGVKLINRPKKNYYDIIVLAVAHKIFKEMGAKKIKSFGKKNNIFFDVKMVFDRQYSDLQL